MVREREPMAFFEKNDVTGVGTTLNGCEFSVARNGHLWTTVDMSHTGEYRFTGWGKNDEYPELAGFFLQRVFA